MYRVVSGTWAYRKQAWPNVSIKLITAVVKQSAHLWQRVPYTLTSGVLNRGRCEKRTRIPDIRIWDWWRDWWLQQNCWIMVLLIPLRVSLALPTRQCEPKLACTRKIERVRRQRIVRNVRTEYPLTKPNDEASYVTSREKLTARGR